MQIHNTRHLILAATDHQTQKMRVNALFLSSVFNDQQTMRKLIHNRSPLSEPILKALVNYHESKDVAKLYQEIEAITIDENGMLKSGKSCLFVVSYAKDEPNNPYLIPDKNGYSRYLKDAGGAGLQGFNPSNWLKLDLYDKPITCLIQDRNFPQGSSRNYQQAKPIDVLKETLDLEQKKLRNCPQTTNKPLDMTLANLFNNPEPNEQILTKSLSLINQDLIAAFSQRGPLTFGHFDAVNLLQDKTAATLDKMDYYRQRELYKTDLCREAVKFSYLTTFTKNKNFDQEDLNKHLLSVKNSGSWIIAGHLIANKITANSTNIIGLNNSLISLSTIRPLPQIEMIPILRKYHNEDSKRIADNYINLEMKIRYKGLHQHD